MTKVSQPFECEEGGDQNARPADQLEKSKSDLGQKRPASPPSLRPPTLMIDLLFGALMLFAFQMGTPVTSTISIKEFDLPKAQQDASKKPANLIPVRPRRNGDDGWLYEIPNGQKLTASELGNKMTADKKIPVLVVAHDAKVQNYIDAEEPLKILGIKTGLAVATEAGEK